MRSLQEKFDELRQRIAHGRETGYASDEPIYYLIFPPSEILEVKRAMLAWEARLRNDGWIPSRFSMYDTVNVALQQSPVRTRWLRADEKAPLDWKKTNAALSNEIARVSIKDLLIARLQELRATPKTLLLITDLEALHPYARIGAIEGQLYGHFHVPTVVLYPGLSTGKSALKFLGFYPEDGNYRSVHVGD